MLLAIRDKVTSWVGYVIVGLLIIPFALWGISEYLGGGSTVNVAMVNDVPISRNALNNQYQRDIRARDLQPEGEEAFLIKQAVLDRMIREELLINLAHEGGYRISEGMLAATIRSTSYFQRDGQFDEQLYRNILQSNGLSPEMYQNIESRSMLINQVLKGISDTGFTTTAELDQFIRLKDRTLELSYIVLPVTRYEEGLTISDEQIAAYYEANRDRFMTPERVKVQYIKLDVMDFESTIEVTDVQLRSLYEDEKDSYQVAEQRRVAHILIEVPAGASADVINTAMNKAQDIRQQLEDGADFADLAKKHSDDIGSASVGGDLRFIEKGTMDTNFEASVYNLKQGEVSDPIRSTDGFHLIKLTVLKPPEGKSFEQARAEVEAQYRQRGAEDSFNDRADALIDLTYENPETLEIAARDMGLEIQESEWFTRQGDKTGVAKYSNVVNAAFSEDALGGGDITKGYNSKSLELQREDATRLNPILVLHVSEYESSTLRALEDVRKIIEGSLRKEVISQKAKDEGEKLIADARNGSDLEELAGKKQLELVKAGYIKRSETGHNVAVVQQAFSMGSPASSPVYGGTQLATGAYVFVTITGEKLGDPGATTGPEKKYLSQFIQNLYGTAEVDAMVNTLKQESEVIIFKDRLKDDDS